MAATADVRVSVAADDVVQYPVKASTTIYDGTMVGLDGSNYARGLVAGDNFVGINVAGKADNSSGSAGDISVQVRRRAIVKLSVTGLTSRELHGALVFASADDTFTLTRGVPGATTLIGRVVEYVSSGVGYVQVDADCDIDQAALGHTLPAQIDTAGAATYTTAQVLSGMIDRDPNGGARTDVTPTAAAMIAARGKAAGVGDNFLFILKNSADASETITLSHGVGVTIVGDGTIEQNNTKLFRYVQTSGTEVSIYSIMTGVH